MTIKLIIVDLDGTVVGKSNEINARVRETVATIKTKGIKIAIATGRMYRSALRFHGAIDSDLPIIAYNGAWMQSPIDGTIYQHLPVSTNVSTKVLDFWETSPWRSHLRVHFYIDDSLYVSKIYRETEKYAMRSQIEPIVVEDLRSLLTRSTTKILTMSNSRKKISKLLQELPEILGATDFHLTQSTNNFLEITNSLAHKGTGVRYLAEKILGLDSSEVMAIGDNYNDTEMLKYAGLSIAMGDAPPRVKEIADWVAPDVENDGAAVAMEKFLF